MTTNRDPDRKLRAWLDLMPDEAPDRVLSAVSQAVETTPQVRRPLDPAFRRFPRMNRFLPAAALVAVAVIAVGAFAFNQNRAIGPGQATTSPSTQLTLPPSATPSLSPVPAALRHLWVGASRDVPGIQSGAATALELDATSLAFAQANTLGERRQSSTASMTSDGHLRLESGGVGCNVGAIGTYSVSTSTSGRRLTIAAVSDPCTVRTTAVAGDWSLSGCKLTNDPCLGDLDAGTYGTMAFAPHLPGGVWTPVYGNLTYTVPDGWADAEDFPNSFRLVRSSDYATETKDGTANADWTGIAVMARAHVPDVPADCSDHQDATKNLAYPDLLAYVRALPALAITNDAAVKIGGLSGRSLDLSLAPAWTGQCSGLGAPSYGYLASSTAQSGGSGIGILGVERARLILLDSGAGDTIAIQLQAPNAASFDRLAASAMPIINGFQFK